MTDTRFTTVFEDLEELLAVVDLDDVDDLDTLIMVLLGRPVVVAEGGMTSRTWMPWTSGSGRRGGAGVFEPFPISVLELARSSAELARDIGPYVPDRGATDRGQ